MPEITCDYMVPCTVRVNTDTGEALSVWLHLESFQSAPPGRFYNTDGDEIMLRNAFLSDDDDRPAGVGTDGYACDGESTLGDRALEIADRVTLGVSEMEMRFTLEPPVPVTQ